MGEPEEEKGKVFDYEIPEEITFKQPESKTLVLFLEVENEENPEENSKESW